MWAFDVYYLFEEKKEYDYSHPDKKENSEDGFSACIHYKKVKEGVQYNRNEQPNGASG